MSDQKTVVEFSIDSKRDFVTLLNRTGGSFLDPNELEILELLPIEAPVSPKHPNTQVRVLFRQQEFTLKYRRLDMRHYIVETHGSTLAVPNPILITDGEVRQALLAQYKIWLHHTDIQELLINQEMPPSEVTITLRPDHLTWLPEITLPVTKPTDIRHWLTKRELPTVFL